MTVFLTSIGRLPEGEDVTFFADAQLRPAFARVTALLTRISYDYFVPEAAASG